ncbi:trigger factor [Buchnera aphidicola]|uniref:Trigger factor n=1 Tax=Buchnera aphidicola (Anoecia oenotherae) TaxID=1241833 RepID=A0A4D6Y0X0_9GAMM|nr:trigger factor [Buchnera aphidicola]QCI19481.1 trigger factor [Buchnera aphidicola (Anoecia oenotherae)]
MKKKKKENKTITSHLVTLNISKQEFLKRINLESIILKKNISLHGFRKGKVPLNIIYEMHKNEIMQKSLTYLMEKNFLDYLNKKKCKILEYPKYIFQGYSLNKTITYSVKFYEYLSPSIQSIKNTTIIKPIINITNSDKSFYLKKIYKNYLSWKNTSYSLIQKSDKITIDYELKFNNLYIEKYKTKNFSFTIENKLLFSEIRNKLLGHKIGDICNIYKTFSSNYCEKELKGKKVKIVILIKNVEKPCLSISKKREFLKKIKNNLFNTIKKKIKIESNVLKKIYIKKQVINNILKRNSISFPKKIIKEEMDLIYKYYNVKYKKNFRCLLSVYSEKKVKTEAIKNLILKLTFKKIINDNPIVIDKNIIQKFFQNYLKEKNIYSRYLNTYYKNTEIRKKVDNHIIEKQIYLSLLKIMKIIYKKYSFQQFLKKI